MPLQQQSNFHLKLFYREFNHRGCRDCSNGDDCPVVLFARLLIEGVTGSRGEFVLLPSNAARLRENGTIGKKKNQK